MQNDNRTSASAVINSIFSAFIPIIIMLATYAIAGVHPFGDRLLMCAQNSGWYEQLGRYHAALTGDPNVFYSLTDGLGGQFYTDFINGFCNPFWLITAIYPAASLPEAVPFVMIIQSAFAGFFTYTLLCRLCPDQKLAAAAFSAAYAGGSLFTLGFLAPQFTGAAVFLPLVGAGIYLLCERGSTLLLFFSVIGYLASAATLWPCLLIFIIIFYSWCSLVAGDKAQSWTRSALLIVCVGLSFASAAVLLLPSMITGTDLGRVFPAVSEIDTASVGSIINALFAGSFAENGAAPLIFCSSMTLLMLPLYYLNRSIGIGERQMSFFSLISVLISMTIPVFGWIWLFPTDATGIVVGFGFVFCLIAVAAAARSLAESAKSSVRKMMLSWLIIAILFGVSVILRWGKSPVELLIFSVASLTLMAAITLVVLSSKNITSGFSIILMLCIACECVLGGTYSISKAAKALPLITKQEYAVTERTENWIDSTISSCESSMPSPFFRIRGGFSADQCSITGPASTPSAEAFLDAMGISGGKGFTPFTDAFFGVKYIVSDRASEYTYPVAGRENESTLFMNGAALTVGCTVPAYTADAVSYSADPFIAQNELATVLSGADRQIFHSAEVSGCSGIGASITETLTGTEIIRSAPAGYVQFSVTAPSSGMMYMYISCDEHSDEAASFNGQSLPLTLGAINCLGYCNRGDSVELVMTVTGERLEIGGVYFAVLDSALCSDTIAEIGTRQLAYVGVKGNHVRGTVTVPEGQILLTTIPYQSGWKAASSSGSVKVCSAAGAFLALRLPAGTQSIELWYEPPYFTVAVIISLISFALGLIYSTAAEVIRRNNEEAAEAAEAAHAAEAEAAMLDAEAAMYQQPEDYAQYDDFGQYNQFGEYVYAADAQYTQPEYAPSAFVPQEQPQQYSGDYFDIYGGPMEFSPVNDTEDEYSDEYYENY